MKPTLAQAGRALPLALTLAPALLLGGCGQTGPLYMPVPPAPASKPAPVTPQKPATPAAAATPSS